MAKLNLPPMSAHQLSEKLGESYFYRQKIYRLFENGLILARKGQNGQLLFNPSEMLDFFEKNLRKRLKEMNVLQNFRFDYSLENKEINVSWDGHDVQVGTDQETETDLIGKILKEQGKFLDLPKFKWG